MKYLGLIFAFFATTLMAQEYVDLDLPSGTLWATYNVGGSQIGDRTATEFNWGNLVEESYGDKKRWEVMYSLGNTTQGSVTYDPATVAWGDDWCTPTLEQWYELLNCCRYDCHTTAYGELAVRYTRMYDTDNDGYPDTYDPDKFIVFTFNRLASGNYVGGYWTTTQNMNSWPKDEERDTTYIWHNEKYDFSETIDIYGTPSHIYPEHGYAYNFYFNSSNASLNLTLSPPSHQRMVRAVKKSNSNKIPISIGKSGKASYCGDKSLDFSFSDEVKAYIATGFDKDEGTIWLTRVKDVPAGVPVLIKGGANKTYDVPVTDGENSYYTNMFVGNTSGEKIQIQETDGDMMNYYLSGDGTFKSVNKSANIGNNKCYLQLPGTFEATATGAAQTVKVGSIGKASFAAPVDLDFTNVDGLKAFTATGYDKSTKTIWLTRVMKVQKGEGVLLKGDPNSYEIPSAAVQSSYENMFIGNTSGNEIQVQETSEDGSQTNYYLSGKDGSFVKVSGYANINTNKCYLELPTSMVSGAASTRSSADSFIFEEPEMIKLPISFRSLDNDGDGTTAIRDLTPALSEGEGAWYTLQGQRVANPGKGVYIKNGRKVVIK